MQDLPRLRRSLRRSSRHCDACCLACLCLLLQQPLPVDSASAKDPDAPTAFAAISDWGGIGVAPFTSSGQMAVATALVEAGQANGYQFVLSAGNNFLPTGLPRACRQAGRLAVLSLVARFAAGPASSAASTERFQATWQGVYEGLPVPWYVTGGYADWMGNATAERAFTHAKPQPGVLSWQVLARRTRRRHASHSLLPHPSIRPYGIQSMCQYLQTLAPCRSSSWTR